MFYHDWVLAQLAQERRRDLLRTLEHERLIKEAETSEPQHGHRLYHVLDWIGRQLIRWGESLQARHAVYHRQTVTHTTGG